MNRRLIAIILAACLALCLLGCNQEGQPSLENPTTTEPNDVTEPDTQFGNETNDGGAQPLDDTTNSTEQPSENTEAPTEQPTTGQTGNQEQPTQDSTEPTEKPTEPEGDNDATEPNSGNVSTGATAYEQYYNMSGDEQKAFIESFGSIEAFFEWHNAAKAEYEALHPDIEIDGGSVDLGGGNG